MHELEMPKTQPRPEAAPTAKTPPPLTQSTSQAEIPSSESEVEIVSVKIVHNTPKVLTPSQEMVQVASMEKVYFQVCMDTSSQVLPVSTGGHHTRSSTFCRGHTTKVWGDCLA